MEEKVLIKSYCPDTKKFFKVMMIIGLVLGLIFFMVSCSNVSSDLAKYKETYEQHQAAGKCGSYYGRYEQCWRCEYVEEHSAFGSGFGAGLSAFAAVMVLALVIKLLLTSFSLVVTDKRVYCKVLWIHHVCLSVDSITAVARVGIINALAIGAPAGRIFVSFVMNSKDIYEVLNNLFIARQEKSLAAVIALPDEPVKDTPKPSIIDPATSTSVKPASTANAGEWKCTCGKIHKDYEMSCVCGVTKAEAKMKN